MLLKSTFLAFKKSGKNCPGGGGGVGGANLDKNQNNSNFFRESIPYTRPLIMCCKVSQGVQRCTRPA